MMYSAFPSPEYHKVRIGQFTIVRESDPEPLVNAGLSTYPHLDHLTLIIHRPREMYSFISVQEYVIRVCFTLRTFGNNLDHVNDQC